MRGYSCEPVRTWMRSPGRPNRLNTSAGPSPCAAEPVRPGGVELDRLTDTEDEVLLAEDQPHPTGEDVEPLIAVVRAQLSAWTAWSG